MERKISSSFTEFYKVFGIVSTIIFLIIWETLLFDSFSNTFNVLAGLFIVLNIVKDINFWRMKEVEITDAGLIITDRFFFTQQTIFVPFEKIEKAKNKFSFFGNNKSISIIFSKNTEFGDKISFLSNAFTKAGTEKMVEDLNQIVWEKKSTERLNSALL